MQRKIISCFSILLFLFFALNAETKSIKIKSTILPAGAGIVAAEKSGDAIIIRALPNPGYAFIGWGSGVSSQDNPLKLTEKPKTITANFQKEVFSFDITCDMRNMTGENPNLFRGACEALAKLGPGLFMLTPGDEDPPARVLLDIQNYIKKDNYPWYPVIGNHEAETPSDMEWLRAYNKNGNTLPNIVNVGPKGSVETMYSFDYGDIHFAIINEYYDGKSDIGNTYLKGTKVKFDARFTPPIEKWLRDDLAKNKKPYVFVLGHEPAFVPGDMENGLKRHDYDSLDQYPEERDRFWKLLKEFNVLAYLTGHTHTYSAVVYEGIWQIDAGHARGTGERDSRSAFVKVHFLGEQGFVFDTYRLNWETNKYILEHSGKMN